MKTNLLAFIMIILGAGMLNAQELKQVWESSDDVLKTPESVLYDEERDVIFVANINGNPSEKDGNGFISTLNPDGTLKELNWLEGLNAPKGMAIYEGKLYVADIDELVEIDIKKKEIAKTYYAPDAVFLNDVAACQNGMIFVSDTRTIKVHVLQDGKLKVWMEGEPLQNPNGLFTEKGHLYIGDRNIYKVDIKSKKMTKVVEDAAGVDGLEKTNNGDFVFSNWPGRIWINQNGKNIKF